MPYWQPIIIVWEQSEHISIGNQIAITTPYIETLSSLLVQPFYSAVWEDKELHVSGILAYVEPTFFVNIRKHAKDVGRWIYIHICIFLLYSHDTYWSISNMQSAMFYLFNRNSLNCLMKLAAWMYSGSHSMFAEFIHSMADTINQVCVSLATCITSL